MNTNIDYSIRIPESAQGWVSHVSTNARAIVRSERLVFRVKPNTTMQARYTTIDLVDNLGMTSETILVHQRGEGTATTIIASSPGKLKHEMSTWRKDHVQDLRLVGKLDPEDYEFLRSMPKLRSLDLSEINNTDIPPGAFAESNIPNIILPLNLTAIPDHAFENSKITSIYIPKTVTSIGLRAFAGTSALRGDIIIPDATVSVGASAFENSKFNGKLKLGANLKRIGGWAFYQGTYSSVEWNECLQSIGMNAFAFAKRVKGDVRMPNTLTSLGLHAFRQSAFDGALVLSQELTEIPDYAFYGCKFKKELMIPDKVVRIGEYAFYNWEEMRGAVTIGLSVKKIENYSFASTRFSTVYCKAQVPPEGPANAFYGYSALKVPRGTRKQYMELPIWSQFYNQFSTPPQEVDF